MELEWEGPLRPAICQIKRTTLEGRPQCLAIPVSDIVEWNVVITQITLSRNNHLIFKTSQVVQTQVIYRVHNLIGFPPRNTLLLCILLHDYDKFKLNNEINGNIINLYFPRVTKTIYFLLIAIQRFANILNPHKYINYIKIHVKASY